MDYLEGHRASGLKPGDKVRVTRVAEAFEQGWKNEWTDDMDDFIGKKHTIKNDEGVLGFSIEDKDGYFYCFPYFVLEKQGGKMKPEEATQTKDGKPVRIYATDGGGEYPVHGAIWNYEFSQWVLLQWSLNGVFISRDGEKLPPLDLDLTDWKDEIPWECIKKEIKYVAKWKNGGWLGFRRMPTLSIEGTSWVCDLNSSCYSLSAVKMPEGPKDWTQALAKRPEKE